MRPGTEQSNTENKLDAIAREINHDGRRSVFRVGALLLKARKECKHGEWGPWLRREIGWSDDTAANYMNAARLVQKYRTVRNLKVPVRALYRLAALDKTQWADAVDTLQVAAKTEPLSAADAEQILRRFDTPKKRKRLVEKAACLPDDVTRAISTILRDAGFREMAVDAVSIQVAIDHLSELARKMQGDDPVKAAADRAEARSRKGSVVQFPA